MIATTKELEVGDFLKCADSEELITYMEQLAKAGIETDWCNTRNGKDGLWLEVIATKETESENHKKLLEAMNFLHKHCDENDCESCYFGYGGYHCFFEGMNPTEWGFKSIFED